MARSLSSAFLRLKAEPQARPVELWDVHLGSVTSVDANTLFFAVTNQNLRFYSFVDGTPQVYLGLGINRSPIVRNIDSKIDSVEVSLDNVTRAFSQYFLDVDLRGKRIVIRKVFANYMSKASDADGDNFVTMFDGILDAPSLSQTRLSAQLRNNYSQSLAFNVPRRTYQGPCNLKFGASGDCAAHLSQKILFNPKNGSLQSVPSQVHFVDSNRSEGGSGDYWAPGIIQMTAGTPGNIGVKRRIVQSTHTGDIFLENNFPYAVVAGDQYTVQRDCGHTLDKDCRDRFQNNSEYGGFTSIPENLVVRV